MTSTTYRQSSKRDPAKDATDRANALYGRFPVRRLEAEAVLDRMLIVAGRLDRTPFGSSGCGRRGRHRAGRITPRRQAAPQRLYLQVRRSKPIAFLSAFDAPALEPNCDRRNVTTTAPQSLMLLNSDFVRKQAGHLAVAQ